MLPNQSCHTKIEFTRFFTLSSVNVCNFADDATSFVCDLNLEVVLAQLMIAWFQNNYMKLNTDKFHLFVAGDKFEHAWVRVGPDKIRPFHKTTCSLNRQQIEV